MKAFCANIKMMVVLLTLLEIFAARLRFGGVSTAQILESSFDETTKPEHSQILVTLALFRGPK